MKINDQDEYFTIILILGHIYIFIDAVWAEILGSHRYESVSNIVYEIEIYYQRLMIAKYIFSSNSCRYLSTSFSSI